VGKAAGAAVLLERVLSPALLCRATPTPPALLPSPRATLEPGAMDWSARQGDILTGGGRLVELYNAPAFPWREDELPHYYKLRDETHETFARWKAQGRTSTLVAGAWARPLFVGGWQHTGDHTERVFNVQTPSLFIDLRLPLLSDRQLARGGSMDVLSDEQLRLLARRHCFAGYSLLNAGGVCASGRAYARAHAQRVCI
jgi:hypothetical protein